MAAQGINQATIMNHPDNEPDMRYMPNSDPAANISIATPEERLDKTPNSIA